MAYLSGLGDLGRWEYEEETGQFHWMPQAYEGWFTRHFGSWFTRTPGYGGAGYPPSQWFYYQRPQARVRPVVQQRGECVSYDYRGRCAAYMPTQ